MGLPQSWTSVRPWVRLVFQSWALWTGYWGTEEGGPEGGAGEKELLLEHIEFKQMC